MRLYRTTAGRWAGTQADAGKGHTLVEVPTDKPGLLAFLNEQPAPAKPFAPLIANVTQAPPSNLNLAALGGGVAGVRAAQIVELSERLDRIEAHLADVGMPVE